MHIYRAKKYDSALEFKQKENFNIVEIYNTACLTRKKDTFVTLLSKERSGLPGSINLSIDEFNRLKKIGDSLTVSFESAQIWDSKLTKETGFKTDKNIIDKLVEILDKNKIPAKTDLNFSGINLNSIVGKGPGLTPAGDDFIAGALNAAYVFDDTLFRELKNNLKEDIGKTTKLSRYYLDFAISGRAGEDMIGILKAIKNKNLDKIKSFGKNILDYGASSGYYTVKGLLWALRKI